MARVSGKEIRELPVETPGTCRMDQVRFVMLRCNSGKYPRGLLPAARSRADSNRCRSFCRAQPSHSATRPYLPGKTMKISRQKKQRWPCCHLCQKFIDYNQLLSLPEAELSSFCFRAERASRSPKVDFSTS